MKPLLRYILCICLTALLCHAFQSISYAQNLSQDLIFHYDFNGDTEDVSGNNIDGIGQNLTGSADRFGNADGAFYFNGTTSFISIPYDVLLKPDFPFSFSYWIKVDPSFTGNAPVFISDYLVGSYNGGFVAGFSESLGRAGFAFLDGGGAVSSTNRRTIRCYGDVRPQEWNLVVGSFESLTSIVIYINGCPCTSYEMSGSGGPMVTTSQDATINTLITDGSHPFIGDLDDIYFWSRALTVHDVNELNDWVPNLPPFDIGNDTILCENVPFTVSVPPGYQNIQWSTGASGGSITVTGEEVISVTADDVDCGSYIDTIVIQRFMVDNADTIFVDLCPNDTFFYFNETYTASGFYTVELPFLGENGCDTFTSIIINEISHASSSVDRVICDGDSLIFGDSTWFSAGVYDYVLEDASSNGCDSIIIFNVAFFPSFTFVLDSTICHGDSLLIGEVILHQSNLSEIIILEGQSSNGCDSTIDATVAFFPASTHVLDTMLCAGGSIIINGTIYDEGNSVGSEVIVGGSVLGCDSTIEVMLSFDPISTSSFQPIICPNDSIEINGRYYFEGNEVGRDTIFAGPENMCDSIVNISVSFFEPVIFFLNEALCEADSIVVNGTLYNIDNPTGVEIFENASSLNCDSSVIVNLSFNTFIEEDLIVILCINDSIIINDEVYNQSRPNGIQQFPGGSINGCDSILNIFTLYRENVISTILDTICPGDSVLINSTYYQENNSHDTLIYAIGPTQNCDSIVYIAVSFRPPSRFELNETICEGDSLFINGTAYHELNPTGIEIFETASMNGCDSTVEVSLTFYSRVLSPLDFMLCQNDSVVVNGIVYNSSNPSGVDTLFGASSTGCDSILEITVQIVPSLEFLINDTICLDDTMVINGVVYDINNPAGQEQKPSMMPGSCDTIFIIDLSFYPIIESTFDDLLCAGDSIIINGTTYNFNTPAGQEVLIDAGSKGCDSIVNINLNFYNEIESLYRDTLCVGDSLILNGTIYSESNPTGIERLIGASTRGCDSIVNMDLTFLADVTHLWQNTYCMGDSISVNGTTYSQFNPSGIERLVGAASSGCDSVISIDLTFIDEIVFLLMDSICIDDTIIVNSTPYFQNNLVGTERFIGGAQGGCDSVVEISLQVIPNADGIINAILCEGDSLIIGDVVFNESNMQGQVILQNAASNGCDSIIDVTVVFFEEFQTVLTDTIFPGEEIEINNIIISEAGTFMIFQGVSQSGCDSIVELNVFVENNLNRIYIPNAFSPNNDGINDHFSIFNVEPRHTVQVEIYDRWGAKVFENVNTELHNDPRVWDGKFKGKPCNQGVYAYVVRISNQFSSEQILSGNLTLLN